MLKNLLKKLLYLNQIQAKGVERNLHLLQRSKKNMIKASIKNYIKYEK